MRLLKRSVKLFNQLFVRVMGWPVIGPWLRRNTATITYTGRRSGRRFTTPVGYSLRAGKLVIPVYFPDAKSWWRNFTEPGQSLTIHLPFGDRTGPALARRDGRYRASVLVDLL